MTGQFSIYTIIEIKDIERKRQFSLWRMTIVIICQLIPYLAGLCMDYEKWYHFLGQYLLIE